MRNELCFNFKQKLESKINKNLMSNYQTSTGALKLEPISYTTQVVAGRNLFIKVILVLILG